MKYTYKRKGRLVYMDMESTGLKPSNTLLEYKYTQNMTSKM